jgi:hypothetical protein
MPDPTKDDVELPDNLPADEEDYPPWLKPAIPAPPPPPPTPLPQSAEVADPFAPRGYDLPADPVQDKEDVKYLSPAELGAGAIVAKALEGAGLSFSGQSAAYAEFLFPAEFTRSQQQAQANAKGMSSCGIFARACYAAAGATYYFNPKSNGWLTNIKKYGGGVTFDEGGSTNSTVHIENPNKASGAVGKALGPAVVVKNYFTDEYLVGSAISAFIQIGLSRGALKYEPGKSKGKMCVLKAGDVLIIGSPEHVIVCISDFDPNSDTYFDAVEGGQSDVGNTPPPPDPKLPPTPPPPAAKGYSPTAFMPSRFFWNLNNAKDANVDGHAAGGEILKKIFKQSSAAVNFNGGRQLLYVIEAAKFIV